MYRLLCCIILLLVSSGCLHLRQQISIANDNTGEFEIQLSLPLNVYRSFVENSPERAPWPWSTFFDPRQGAAHFSAAAGFRINKYRVWEHEERMNVQINGDIVDLKAAMASERLGRMHIVSADGQPNVLQFDKGWLPDAANEQRAVSDNKEVDNDIRELCRGLYLQLTIEVPGVIRSSSATTSTKRSAQWIFDPAVDDRFLFEPLDINMIYE